MIVKLAFDVSTTNIGVCMYESDKEFWTHTIQLPKSFAYDYDTLNTNLSHLDYELRKFKYGVEIQLAIELSNFSNPKMTQAFSFYAGIIVERLFRTNKIVGIKVFNSNEWQYLIGCTPQSQRNERKEKAQLFAFEKAKNKKSAFKTQDEIDAYCMCVLYDKIITTDEHKQIITNKKELEKKNDKLRIKLLKKFTSNLKRINSLDAKINKRLIERLKQENENIEKELSVIDSK